MEALIEFRATFDRTLALDDLASMRDALGASYKHTGAQREWTGRIDLGASGAASSGDLRDVGFLLTTEDKRRAVQLRIDGLRFSRLNSYDGWESFRDEARALWSQYRGLTNPNGLERIGVRFINRIPIPPIANLKHYLKTGPEIASSLEQNLSNLFMRVVVPVDAKTRVVVTELIDERQTPSSVVLDIDAIGTGPLEVDDSAVWAEADRLRDIKNRFFFESVTDKVIELGGGFV